MFRCHLPFIVMPDLFKLHGRGDIMQGANSFINWEHLRPSGLPAKKYKKKLFIIYNSVFANKIPFTLKIIAFKLLLQAFSHWVHVLKNDSLELGRSICPSSHGRIKMQTCIMHASCLNNSWIVYASFWETRFNSAYHLEFLSYKCTLKIITCQY